MLEHKFYTIPDLRTDSEQTYTIYINYQRRGGEEEGGEIVKRGRVTEEKRGEGC